jgi:hypothetical protein
VDHKVRFAVNLYPQLLTILRQQTKFLKVHKPVNLGRPPKDSWEQQTEKIIRGSYESLKDEVIFHWARCNRKCLTGDNLPHILAREGYLEGMQFLLDPQNHSHLDHNKLNFNQVAITKEIDIFVR